MDLIKFGLRLRQAREEKHLTQEELVERLGRKDITAISEYENGKRRLAAFEVPDFAQALGVPITYFYEEVLPEDELETALIEWFRLLPGERAKRRIFTYMKNTAPHILIGDEVDKPETPTGHQLNDQRAPYPPRKKRHQ